MTLKEAKQLKAGDVVWWDDPDEGTCSRLYYIKAVAVNGDIVSIEDRDGGFVECYARELSPSVEKTFKVRVNWQMEGEVEVKAYSKGHASNEAVDAPLPPSDTWTYVPNSCCVVDEKLDVKEIQ